MVSIILVVLFICQLLSFFFILLLNSKLAKFNGLEMRQERMAKELDDALSLYLLEMKEENDRLIQELNAVKQTAKKESLDRQGVTDEQRLKEVVASEAAVEPARQKPYVPVTLATKAYKQQKQLPVEQSTEKAPEKKVAAQEIDEQQLPPFEKEVVEMYRTGKTIEEIAQIMQKGKTEIELLLKFHA